MQRLACPGCGAEIELGEAADIEAIERVRCSYCGTRWNLNEPEGDSAAKVATTGQEKTSKPDLAPPPPQREVVYVHERRPEQPEESQYPQAPIYQSGPIYPSGHIHQQGPIYPPPPMQPQGPYYPPSPGHRFGNRLPRRSLGGVPLAVILVPFCLLYLVFVVCSGVSVSTKSYRRLRVHNLAPQSRSITATTFRLE